MGVCQSPWTRQGDGGGLCKMGVCLSPWAIAQMHQQVAQYEAEFQLIQVISTDLAFILVDDFNIPYNHYLDLLIDEERKEMDTCRDKVDLLIQLQATRQQSVDILSKAISNKWHSPVSRQDISSYRDQLLALPYSGPQLAQIHDKK